MNKKKDGVGRVMWRLISSIVLGANLVCIILLWACCLSTLVQPTAHGHIAVVGLAFPVILVINLLFVPLWLVLRWRWAIVPLLGIACVSSYVLDYFPLNRQAEVPNDALKVVSWNVKGFSVAGEMMDSVLAQFVRWDADIVSLQEAHGSDNVKRLTAYADSLGYEVIEKKGRRILSRYPILDNDTIVLPTEKFNGALIAHILKDGDTITVINCHLESNRIDDKDRTEGREAIASGESERVVGESRQMWGKLANCARLRGQQTDVLTALIDSIGAERNIILMGDFNDTPISYAYQQINKRLRSAYRQAGWGVGVSYNEPHFTIRIDHLFHSPQWQTKRAEIPPHSMYSDHNPLLVSLVRE